MSPYAYTTSRSSEIFRRSSSSSNSSKDNRTSISSWSKIKRYRWVSNYDYIVLSLASTISLQRMFNTMVHVKNDDHEPTFLHYVLAYFFVGMPLVYMQVILGQYSQLGLLYVQYLCPIGYGIGYAFAINSVVKCMSDSMLLADVFMYFMSSMQNVLRWNVCPESMNYTQCWDLNSKKYCQVNCISKEAVMSTRVYWTHMYMQGVDIDPPKLILDTPLIARTVTLMLSWSIIYIILFWGINEYKKILRINLYLEIGIATVLLAVCLVSPGSFRGIENMFDLKLHTFFSTVAWSRVIYDVIELLGVCTVCHMMYGSYLRPDANSKLMVATVVMLNYLRYFIGAMTANASIGIIVYHAGMNDWDIKYIWFNGYISYLNVLPQAIGFLSVAQIWSILYFFMCTLISFSIIVAQMDAIEKCISDGLPKIGLYRTYLLAIMCISIMFICIPLMSKGAHVLAKNTVMVTLPSATAFYITFMGVVVFWIYGVQRLSDDIHFLHGQQPDAIWKLCWYAMPILTGMQYLVYSFSAYALPNYRAVEFVGPIMYFLFISPIPILAGHQLFRFLQMHRLIGLFQPAERWGPLDPDERHLRHKFNPREETHSRRRDNTCKHECLLESKILMRAIECERNIRMERVNEIVREESDFHVDYYDEDD